MPETASGGHVPKAVRPHVDQILASTDQVCHEHLDAAYAELCRRIVEKLARKRPSPLVRGSLRIWAAGVVYAVGQVNFIFDPAQSPHATADQLSTWFEVKKTTMANKGAMIRDLLNLSPLDTEFMHRNLIDAHPLPWLVAVDGMLADARQLPRHIQEQAFEQGLIPYVPEQSDRQ